MTRTSSQLGDAEIWVVTAAAPIAAQQVTAMLAQSAAASLVIVAFTGADLATPIGASGAGSNSTGAPTASLVTTRAGAWVWGVGDDWDLAIARTPDTGQTVAHEYFAGVEDTSWVQHQDVTTPVAGTTVIIDDTAPTTDRYNVAICEILPRP